jgi:hypothetical protein
MFFYVQPWRRIITVLYILHEYLCLFVVYLTTLFQYLRLYSVDFYSILICLPSSSEAGETRVRNSR